GVIDEGVVDNHGFGVVGEDGVGADRTNEADDVAKKGAIHRQFTVFVIKEKDILDAKTGGGVTLLIATQANELRGRHRLVVGALGAVRAHKIVKFPALLAPEKCGPGSPEV